MRCTWLGIVGVAAALAGGVVARGAGDPAAKLDLGGGVAMDLVRIKAGKFTMGSPETEKGRRKDEAQVEAVIERDFYLGKYPVTRGQFARFVQDTRFKTEAETGQSGGFGWDGARLGQRKEFNWKNPGFQQTDEHPVVLVTWDDAQAFVHWTAQKTGRQVTLPGEAQWEYACRAGSNTRFYSGDTEKDAAEIAWLKTGDGTRPVGQKKPNAWGLCDMSGNVYEWCADVYGPYKPGGPVEGALDKKRFVLRGGSWIKEATAARSAARYRNTPGSRNADNGFRVLVAVAPTTSGPRGEVPDEHMPALGMVNPPVAMEPVSPAAAPAVAQFGPLDGGLWAVLPCFIGFVVLGLIVTAVVAIIRNLSNSGTATSNSIASRIVDDGFWIDSALYAVGDVIEYSYYGPQGPVRSSFVVEDSNQGQFIYTGVRPDRLQLLSAAALARQRRQQLQQDESYLDDTSSYHSVSSRSSSGSSFPSAY